MTTTVWMIQDNRPFHPATLPGVYESEAAAQAHIDFFAPRGNGFHGGCAWIARPTQIITADDVKSTIAECERIGITREMLQEVS